MADTHSAETTHEQQSMDAILRSIRRIIAEEADAPADVRAPASVPVDEDEDASILELTDMLADDTAETESPASGRGQAHMPGEDGPVISSRTAASTQGPSSDMRVEPIAADQGAADARESQGETQKKQDASQTPPGAVRTGVASPGADPVAEAASMVVTPSQSASADTDVWADGLLSSTAATASEAALQTLRKAQRAGGLAPPSALSSEEAQTTTTSVPTVTLETLVQEALRPLLKTWMDAHLPQIVRQVVEQEVRRLTRESEQ